MELILHIGCEKTGTTSVQFWLHRHSEVLRTNGVFYSAVLGRPNNRRISFYGLEPGTQDDQLKVDGITTPEQHSKVRAEIKRQLGEEVSAARALGCRRFVISNEHCHSRQKTIEDVARIHELVAPLFETIRIICLLRPQVEMGLSRASTLSRNGREISREWIDRDLNPEKLYYRFDHLLERWAQVFGASAVEPVSTRRVTDTVSYFEQLLGVTKLCLSPQKVENATLDYRVVAIINGLNLEGNPGQNELFRIRRLYANELPAEQPLTIDRAWAQQLQCRFTHINAEVSRRWASIAPGDLSPDYDRFPVEGNVNRLGIADEIGPMLRRIVDRVYQEAAMEKARRLSVTCDQEISRGEVKAALDAARQGLTHAKEALEADTHRKFTEGLIARLESRVETLTRSISSQGKRSAEG
jgi:hypothetical protein